MSTKYKGAFTLVELLVVIAIISIVAAMLFPVFASVREKARAIACLNNCRQLGLAEMEYVQDHDETFWNQPGNADTGPFFSDILMPYIKNTGVFRCPSNTAVTSVADSYWPGLHIPPTYVVNYGIADPGIHSHLDRHTGKDLDPYTVSQIDKAQEIVLFADASVYWNSTTCEQDPDKPAGIGSYYVARGNPSTPVDPIRLLGQPLHQGGINFVYADGHAKVGKVRSIPYDSKDMFSFAGYYQTGRAMDVDCYPPFGVWYPQ